MNKISRLFAQIIPKAIKTKPNTAAIVQTQQLNQIVKTDVVEISKKVTEASPIFVSEFKQINKNIVRILSDLEKKYSTFRTVEHNGIEVGAQITNFEPKIKSTMYNGSSISIYNGFSMIGNILTCEVRPPSNIKTRPIKYYIDDKGLVKKQYMLSGAKSKILQDSDEAKNLIQVIKNIADKIDIY